MPSREFLLEAYEHEGEVEIAPGERFFRTVAVCSLLLFGGMGLYLNTHNPPPRSLEEMAPSKARHVMFVFEEEKRPPVTTPATEKPRPVSVEEKKEPEPAPQEPIDLANNPQLDRKVDDSRPDNSSATVEETVRRVYGLRKVYSTGIGAGGTAADAVVGKLGNTLNTDIDTITATDKELKGRLAPITTVHAMPKFKIQVKPEYTKAMIENGVQGIINTKLLIDTDGRVKKVIVMDDLGFGSRQKVREACWGLLFEPAKLRDGTPVAVWIHIPFRFELTR